MWLMLVCCRITKGLAAMLQPQAYARLYHNFHDQQKLQTHLKTILEDNFSISLLKAYIIVKIHVYIL